MKILFINLTFIFLLLSCNGTQAQKSSVSRVSNQEFATLLKSGDIQLIDVRTPAEYNSGHIEGSTLMNIMDGDFSSQLKTLDKSKPVLVYCAVGGRSYRASQMLKDLGFQSIYDLKDGIKGWQKEGYQVVR